MKILTFAMAIVGIVCFFLLSITYSQTIPFAPAVSYQVESLPWHIAGADLNDDGSIDLVTANAGSSSVSILMGLGDGTFAASYNVQTPHYPYSCYLADIDGDNDIDIIVANHTSVGGFTILLNDGVGNLAVDTTYNDGEFAWSAIAVNLDGDSDNDIVLSTEVSGTLYLYHNNGTGRFQRYASFATGSSSHQVIAADIDNDDDLDLVVAGGTSNVISVLFNNGSGAFAAPIQYPCGDNVNSVLATDLNDDNQIDIAGANYGSGDFTLLFNDGNTVFGNPDHYIFAGSPSYIIASDLNLDGLEEIAVTRQSNGQNLLIMQNDGSGNFNRVETLSTGNSPLSCMSADFDNDGDMDLATANIFSNDVSITLNLSDNGIRTCVLFGTVTETDSVTPIPDVFVRPSRSNFTDTTDANGFYSVDSLSRGVHWLAFNHPLYVQKIINGINLAPDETLEVNVSLTRAGWIRGVVTDTSGQPLNDVLGLCTPDNINAFTDSLGNYQFLRLNPGYHQILFQLADYYDYIADSVLVNQSETTELNIIMTPLPPGVVTGTVTEINGITPIENVLVSIPELYIIDTTDSNGTYSFTVEDTGEHQLSFRNPIFVNFDTSGIAVAHGETLIVDVSLTRAGWIRGEVSDTSNNILAGVRITGSPGDIIDTTDINGEYILGPLKPGSYDLEFTILNFRNRLAQRVSVSSGETTFLNIDLFPITPQVEIWFGSTDGSPIIAPIGQLTFIDIYAKTKDYVYVADLHICLGVLDQYIDSLLSISQGTILPPLSEWDEMNFLQPQHSPPNPSGWSSQSFLGFADLGMEPNPYLQSIDPIQILTMVVKPINDISLIGDTVNCLGVGVNAQLGYTSAGDTVGGPGYQVVQHFSPLRFTRTPLDCEYTLGDINGDSNVVGSDVTFGVRYFKGFGVPPPDSCRSDSLPGNNYLYMAGDVNGNCEFRGSDITRLVAFFKGSTNLSYCRFFPPAP